MVEGRDENQGKGARTEVGMRMAEHSRRHEHTKVEEMRKSARSGWSFRLRFIA
jgi:hypothetical protein